jgi:alpha-glucuronidase
MSAKADYRITLDYLLNTWDIFVTRVERGYTDDLYEFTNDLSTRDLLEDIVKSVSSVGRECLKEAITPVDMRFMRATYTITKPLLPGIKHDETSRPWWYRVPVRMSKELRSDLTSAALL